jgi:hypothetical protein
MTKFGSYLEEAAVPEWQSQYIDYKRLKNILRRFPEKNKGSTHSAISRVLSKSGLAKLAAPAVAESKEVAVEMSQHKIIEEQQVERPYEDLTLRNPKKLLEQLKASRQNLFEIVENPLKNTKKIFQFEKKDKQTKKGFFIEDDEDEEDKSEEEEKKDKPMVKTDGHSMPHFEDEEEYASKNPKVVFKEKLDLISRIPEVSLEINFTMIDFFFVEY